MGAGFAGWVSTYGANFLQGDPRLCPLGYYGGPTQTMPPNCDSPVVDAGDDFLCPLTDQRGVRRPLGAGSDIGACEGCPFSPPTILTPPDSLTLDAGQTAIFTVVASGAPAPGYQWQFNGMNLTDSARISGASTGQLTISNVQPGDAGRYSVVVTNLYGTAVSPNAVLNVTNSVPEGPRMLPGSLVCSNNQFSFTLQSQAGLGFEIQASTNLVDWATVGTLTNSTGTIPFTTPTAGFTRRFYRARQLP